MIFTYIRVSCQIFELSLQRLAISKSIKKSVPLIKWISEVIPSLRHKYIKIYDNGNGKTGQAIKRLMMWY